MLAWRRRVAAVGLLALVTLTALVAVPSGATAPTPDTAKQVAALVAASVHLTKADAAVIAALPGAPSDFADRVYKIPTLCTTATACVYGDTTATNIIVLFGNSHADVVAGDRSLGPHGSRATCPARQEQLSCRHARVARQKISGVCGRHQGRRRGHQ
jgi:hypothetical protein